jgi:type I restriction enzyme R subunit
MKLFAIFDDLRLIMNKEAQARLRINKLLEESEWVLVDTETQRCNVKVETKIEHDGNRGFIDYVLLDSKGFPLVVVEAKNEDKDPLIGKEQSRTYAKSIHARFIILTNSNVHYLWDLERGNPTIINRFPTQITLEGFSEFKPKKDLILQEVVNDDYLVLTQNPNYSKDPDFINPQTRKDFTDKNKLVFLRPYQLNAIKSIQESIKNGNDRFLFEMATGTGKTSTSAGVIKLFLRTENAKRILFLVDRIELEEQAQKSFNHILKSDYTCVIWKENKEDWMKADIVVSTIQSFMVKNRFKRIFKPDDFDFVISDEAHRSIGGNSRKVFEYFIGYKLGLTATPKDYLKRIEREELNQKDPRELERRLILDTYHTFGCDSGEPTFRYTLLDGVKDGFLINPVVVDARTEITTQLLSDQGYLITDKDEDGNDVEESFGHRDFEKKFFSDETNKIFCKTFLDNCLRDPITGEVGKTLIFCVSQKHAGKITQILNEFADKMFPNKYQSDFAIQVTSSIPEAQTFTTNFTYNRLSGSGNFNSLYITSKTRVCVTCSMMTTGYDCPDVLNVGLMKPIFSPSDFVQMKGRGTRKHNFYFQWIDKLNLPDIAEPNKTKFKLFDFFGNCEYFEEKYNYDEVIKLPVISKPKGKESPPTPPINLDEYFNFNPDPLLTFNETEIGYEGMRVDRQPYEKFKDQTTNDETVQDFVKNEDWDNLEDYMTKTIFDKPNDYFNLEKIRKSLGVDRRISVRDLMELIFGKTPYIKNKYELLEEEFEKFDDRYIPDGEVFPNVKHFFYSYVTDPELRDIIDNKQYGLLNIHPSGQSFKELPNNFKNIIPDYVKSYVPLNKFLS